MGMNKYSVGDWMYGDQENTFYRINGTGELNGLPIYGVSHMLDQGMDKEFKHSNYLSSVAEKDLHPVTDPFNTLLCLISELREKHRKTLYEVDQLTRDIDAVVRTRRLLLCHAPRK